MATKAQLMAELELLKQQMASRDDLASSKMSNAKPDDVGDDQDHDPKSYLSKMLEAHGVDKDEIDALWTQLTEELGDLTREKPLLTTAAAFGVGFILGRMSK